MGMGSNPGLLRALHDIRVGDADEPFPGSKGQRTVREALWTVVRDQAESDELEPHWSLFHRLAAARLLIGMEDPEIVDELLSDLDSPYTRWEMDTIWRRRVVSILSLGADSHNGNDRVGSALRAALDAELGKGTSYPGAEFESLLVPGFHGRQPPVLGDLQVFGLPSQSRVRILECAAIALIQAGARSDPRAVGIATREVWIPERAGKAQLVRLLFVLDPKATLDAFEQLVNWDEDSFSPHTVHEKDVAGALRIIGTPAAIHLLGTMATRHRSAALAAVDALSELDGEHAIAQLDAASQTAEPKAAKKATKALRRLRRRS
jgi:hypothetical protein